MIQGAGEGNIRPNMEESMKFFKKLFTQPQEGGSAGFSTALSPPDRPLHCTSWGTHLSSYFISFRILTPFSPSVFLLPVQYS